MKMYLSVLGNPFFAVTGKDGSFALNGLPPGTYTIAAVHEKYGEQEMKITVGPKDRQARRGLSISGRRRMEVA